MSDNHGGLDKTIRMKTADQPAVTEIDIREKKLWDDDLESIDGHDVPQARETDFKRKQVGENGPRLSMLSVFNS
jgi:hypothetical protein